MIFFHLQNLASVVVFSFISFLDRHTIVCVVEGSFVTTCWMVYNSGANVKSFIFWFFLFWLIFSLINDTKHLSFKIKAFSLQAWFFIIIYLHFLLYCKTSATQILSLVWQKLWKIKNVSREKPLKHLNFFLVFIYASQDPNTEGQNKT